jgi:septum formation protein
LPTPRIVLVSASPRRRDLLSRLAGRFEVGHSTIEELGETDLPVLALDPIQLPAPFNIAPESDPRLWSWRKAIDYIRHAIGDLSGAVILAADTVVVSRAELLGKPKSRDDALRMLQLLSGDSHFVTTGYCVLTVHDGTVESYKLGAVSSEVVMKRNTSNQIGAYVDTGEPYDKAGAYALQGLGGELVREVRGCRTTVIGLPLCAIRLELELLRLPLEPVPPSGYCEACR